MAPDTSPPIIIHADVDAFYASVEQRDNPALRGLPIAVGGDPQRRGVIMTASYEARRSGVRSANAEPDGGGAVPRVAHLTAQVRRVPRSVADHHGDPGHARANQVEPLSLDEAFLDVSTKVANFRDAHDHAREIKTAVRAATQLTISLGVATSKLVAKIASDFDKPDGLTVVPADQARSFLAPLPVRRLWGGGPKTEAIVRRRASSASARSPTRRRRGSCKD